MKYCNHCGKELVDEAEFCTSCGCRVGNLSSDPRNDKPIKGKGLGFVLSFFLGIIGFLIALFLGDEECKGMATKTFVVCLIVGAILGVIYVAIIGSLLSSLSVSFSFV